MFDWIFGAQKNETEFGKFQQAYKCSGCQNITGSVEDGICEECGSTTIEKIIAQPLWSIAPDTSKWSYLSNKVIGWKEKGRQTILCQN